MEDNNMSQGEIFSLLGSIIDMPMDEFKKQIIEQKLNIGTISNLILYLESTYSVLCKRKDAVIELVTKGERTSDDPEVKKAINGLFAEMLKTEDKVLYLKERKNELIDLG
jgi:hypothetical protein